MFFRKFVYAFAYASRDSIRDEFISELHPVISLDGFDLACPAREESGFDQFLPKGLGIVYRELIIDFSESPASAVIQGGILIMLLTFYAIRKIFYIHLD